MKKIGAISIRIFSGFIGILPFFIIYIFSDFNTFLLRYIIGYRRKIIQLNLKKCFPDKTSKELNKIEKKIYKSLSDVMIETIKGWYMSKRQIAKRFRVLNPEVLSKYYNKGQDVLNVAGHYGNWEWGILAVDFQIAHQAVSIYKPMNNIYMEKYLFKKRTRFGMKLISIKDTKTYLKSKRTNPSSFILAADQHPSDKKNAIVVKFFDQDTACLHGPEAYGRNTGMPIVYFDIQRVKRGFYTMEIIELFDQPQKTQFGEITQKYMSTLEEIIRKKPENWLWSHKRWKYSEEDILQIIETNNVRRQKEAETTK